MSKYYKENQTGYCYDCEGKAKKLEEKKKQMKGQISNCSYYGAHKFKKETTPYAKCGICYDTKGERYQCTCGWVTCFQCNNGVPAIDTTRAICPTKGEIGHYFSTNSRVRQCPICGKRAHGMFSCTCGMKTCQSCMSVAYTRLPAPDGCCLVM